MKKLLQLLKPYRKRLSIVLLIDAFGMMMSLLLPYFMSEIVERGIAVKNLRLVWIYAIIMLVLAVLSVVGNIISTKLNTAITAGYTSELCRETFEKINALS